VGSKLDADHPRKGVKIARRRTIVALRLLSKHLNLIIAWESARRAWDGEKRWRKRLDAEERKLARANRSQRARVELRAKAPLVKLLGWVLLLACAAGGVAVVLEESPSPASQVGNCHRSGLCRAVPSVAAVLLGRAGGIAMKENDADANEHRYGMPWPDFRKSYDFQLFQLNTCAGLLHRKPDRQRSGKRA
jgi:hypothetical protein